MSLFFVCGCYLFVVVSFLSLSVVCCFWFVVFFLFAIVCRCLSLSVVVCHCLSFVVVFCLSLFVIVCCLLLFVVVCLLSLSLFVVESSDDL